MGATADAVSLDEGGGAVVAMRVERSVDLA